MDEIEILEHERPDALAQFDALPVVEAIHLAWSRPVLPEWKDECRAIIAAAMPLLARALNRLEAERTPPADAQ